MSRPDPDADMTAAAQVACIGAGYWGKSLVRNFHALGALSWICEVSPERQADLSAQYPGVRFTDSLEPILSDPKVAGVAIATPAETHGDLVRQVLLAGKDVFVEKPLCLSIAEGQELVSLAAQRERVLMVGHLLWYHPAVRKLQELVEAGELGRIQYIYSNRLNLGKIRRMKELRPTRVRRGASLGANCTIVCGVTIGQYAFVGAGAVVLKDVPDHALVVGNPGRVVGWIAYAVTGSILRGRMGGARARPAGGPTARWDKGYHCNEGGDCPLGLPEVGYPSEKMDSIDLRDEMRDHKVRVS